jgi:hypothetical protein
MPEQATIARARRAKRQGKAPAMRALKRESRTTVSRKALSRQAKTAARKRQRRHRSSEA